MKVVALLATVAIGEESLVDHVSRLICSEIADCCAIAVLSQDGRTVHPLGLFDRRDEVMAELEAQPELAWTSSGGLTEQAMLSGEPILVNEADPQVIARGRPLAKALLERLAIDSAIVAPMRSAGSRLGVVAVGRTQQRQPFAAHDVPYIQALADKVALGLVNARLREQVMASGPGLSPTSRPDDSVHRLTGREREILRLIGEGLTNREIGEQLYLSVRTVEWHRSNLSAKLGLTRRSELIAAGRRLLR